MDSDLSEQLVFIETTSLKRPAILQTIYTRTSEFLATDQEVPGSIPGPTRFSEKQGFWNGVHSALRGQLRSYLKKEVAARV
jgi:hypothetical protein